MSTEDDSVYKSPDEDSAQAQQEKQAEQQNPGETTEGNVPLAGSDRSRTEGGGDGTNLGNQGNAADSSATGAGPSGGAE